MRKRHRDGEEDRRGKQPAERTQRLFGKKRLAASAVFVLAGLAVRILTRLADGFADWYAGHVNGLFVNTLGRITSSFPFSCAEVLICAAAAGVVLFVMFGIRILVGRKHAGRYFARGASTLALIAAVVFFLYECGEDVYFYSTPFSVSGGFGTGSYTTAELTAVCRALAAGCNASAGQVARDENGLMQPSADLGARVRRAMGRLGTQYPALAGWYPQPKPVACSELMSRADFSGIYTAFTCEANYNRDMTAYNRPFTMCHELSHVKGVLQENEANFTAFLACISSEDADIRYSGALMGWIYCGNELYKRDYPLWLEIAGTLSEPVNLDIQANTAFWKTWRENSGSQAQTLNDAYLKRHGQALGVESYNRVVDLIVSWYHTQETLE